MRFKLRFKLHNKLRWIIGILCVGLISLNLYGILFGEYRQPLRKDWDMGPQDRVIPRPARADLDRVAGEADEDYFARVTRLIDQYFIHGTTISEVKIWDNYLLWLHDTLRHPDGKYFYETANVNRALRKGVGQCSQFSLIVAGVLADNGYEVRILRLGHVVASARTHRGDWFILDANYGVTIPHDLAYIQDNLSVLDRYYQEIYKVIPEDARLPMKKIFGSKADNKIYTLVEQRGWKAYYFEKISDYLIWLLPLLGLALSYDLLLKKPGAG